MKLPLVTNIFKKCLCACYFSKISNSRILYNTIMTTIRYVHNLVKYITKLKKNSFTSVQQNFEIFWILSRNFAIMQCNYETHIYTMKETHLFTLYVTKNTQMLSYERKFQQGYFLPLCQWKFFHHFSYWIFQCIINF